MALWIRFNHAGRTHFGTLQGDRIAVHEGDLFNAPRSTGLSLSVSDVEMLAPVVPGKIVALANNFHALIAKLGMAAPSEPTWFLKSATSLAAPGQAIRMPASYAGKVIFEGELGIVIGKRCSSVTEEEALAHVFGYTCVNDVTAIEILKKEPGFDQWSRSKSFDTFGPMGPAIVTGLDPMTLSVRTVLDGSERQNYPVADMIFPPAKLIALVSRDVTLEPGDVIACGTSVGVGSMKPGASVEISIEGVGALGNRFAP
jgi:2-keto-4-pentenoate hydratase/2-oxohepta-3-ene-1,7-dioic acid hydratase in catechol pathway